MFQNGSTPYTALAVSSKAPVHAAQELATVDLIFAGYCLPHTE